MTDHPEELTNTAPGFTAAWWSLVTDLTIPDGALRLYLMIASHTRGHRNVAWPGQDRLMQLTGTSHATLKRNLAVLVERGWIKTRRPDRNQGNRYYVMMPRPQDVDEPGDNDSDGSLVSRPDGSSVSPPCRSRSIEVNPPTPRNGGRRTGPLRVSERARDFDAWYERYPRHVAKLDAVKAWRQVLSQLPPLTDLLDATDALIAWTCRDQLNADTAFTPYPATWLRAGRWMDEAVPAVGTPVQVVRPCVMCAAPNPREACNGPTYIGADFDMSECPWRT